MSAIDRLVQWNRTHAAGTPQLRPEPRTAVAVVSCMDARISMPLMLGVSPGDVHVLRNAGGIVTDDTVRSLVVSQVALGTDEVMVIQHTKCGMEGLVDQQFRAEVSRLRGRAPFFEIGGFPEVSHRVVESVRALRRNPLIDAEVRGFVFDVDTGLVEEIEVA
ncbi:MAG: carbonic anhydrase [Acidimicrobiia bacterium]|nr:carbonic anhydrase [Acidimicrobiia bacterium]